MLISFSIFLTVFFSMGTILPFRTRSLLWEMKEGKPAEGVIKNLDKLLKLLGSPLAALCSQRQRSILQGKLQAIEVKTTVSQFFGMKILCSLVILMILCFTDLLGVGKVLVSFGGFFFPDLWLQNKMETRNRDIQRELPFTLDLITIGVEAGLGFESALAKVVKRGEGGPLQREFSRTLQEIQMGRSRQEALQEMAIRVDHPDVTSFVTTLIQAERLGTSIGGILRLLSEQSRVKCSQRAEAAAIKAPVKMLFPLTLFIFPTLLVILLGPALLRSLVR